MDLNVKKKFSYKDQKGFSLISAVVAAGLMSAIGLGVSNLIIQQSNSVSYLEDRLAKVDLKTKVTSLLSEGSSCANTFGGLGVPAVSTPTQIFQTPLKNVIGDDGVVFLETGTSNIDDRLYQQLEITSINLENLNVPIGGSVVETGRVKTVMNVRRTRGLGNIDMAPIELELDVETDVNDLVVSCNVVGARQTASLSEACVGSITSLTGTQTGRLGHIHSSVYSDASLYRGNYTTEFRVFENGETGIANINISNGYHSSCSTTQYTATPEVFSCVDGSMVLQSQGSPYRITEPRSNPDCGPAESN